MKTASQITHEIVEVVELISEIKWQLDDSWVKFRRLQKELDQLIKHIQSTNQK